MARARFEVRATTQDDKPGFYYRLVGANNEIVFTSHPQVFEYPTDARAAAKNARRLARLAKVKR